MKIMVCGKGGSGKSTFSVLLARAFSARGYSVLLVDADESNFGIPHLLGIDAPQDLMGSFGGKKGFKEKLNQPLPADGEGVFVRPQKIGELPVQCVAAADSINVVAIGKIHDYGEGCACPMGILAKKFLASLVLSENEIVIVDAEAGVEHFGRGVIGEVDVVVGLIDPTAESFMLAGKMGEMVENAGKEAVLVLNKVEPEIEAAMMKHLDAEKVIGKIEKDDAMFMASLEGRPLDRSIGTVDAVAEALRR